MLTSPTRIWTAATGDDLGLTTRRIKAAEAIGEIADEDSSDDAVEFDKPNDLPAIVDACHTFSRTSEEHAWVSVVDSY